MIFCENRLLYFCRKLGKVSQNLSSAAVMIGALRVKLLTEHHLEFLRLTGGCRGSSKSTLVKMSNCWKSHAAAHIMLPYLDSNTFLARGDISICHLMVTLQKVLTQIMTDLNIRPDLAPDFMML